MNYIIKKISKFISFLLIIILAITLVQCFIGNESKAAYESYDIAGIDEGRYPGYKSAIQRLQQAHPNWIFKLYYTGLDWQTVINNENKGHWGSPKSLIYDTYSGEWICPTCRTTKYDISGRWYCASQEAIKFMMDPRNSLTEEYIFQFQNLSSAVGDREAVKKITQNTFLYNDSYIDAIMTAAYQNSVSPFHIVSRIIQEQGRNGGGIYAKGYPYNGTIVYNMFNIGASGGIGEYEPGAKKAYEEQWFSAEASIIGGTRFIKKNYIDRGQVSLYFQKYNVVQQGNLYNHQYMQNIGAARTEGLSTYNSYKKNNIHNSQFEFIIPVYENMPVDVSYEPNGNYSGRVVASLNSMELIDSNGYKYITGEIRVDEIINNTVYIPKELPKFKLKSDDGTVDIEMYRYQKQDNTYYFDTIVDALDPTKNYYIEVQLIDYRNIAPIELKNQRLYIADRVLGQCMKGVLVAENSTLKFNYSGIISTNIQSIEMIDSIGRKYISGDINISVNVGGSVYAPNQLPQVKLKSTDGIFSSNLFIYKKAGTTYYYDTIIDALDKTKEYYIEVTLVDSNNVASISQKTKIASIASKHLGMIGNDYVAIEDNKLKFSYQGVISTGLQNLEMMQNAQGEHYISGNIIIIEIVDGETKIPTTLPELTLKSTNGFSQPMFLLHIENGVYYFDTYIEHLDRIKEYYIEAKLTNTNNTAPDGQKKQTVLLNNKNLGLVNNGYVVIENNKLKFSYNGTIGTSLQNLDMMKNAQGAHYISGNVKITETILGETKIPTTLPELTLKSTDGISLPMYVCHTGNGMYYFDTYIEDIDKTKEYYIEAKLTSINNKAQDSQKTQEIALPNKELGRLGDYKVKIANNRLKFADAVKYEGTISTQLLNISMNKNAQGAHYISGNMIIIEIADGDIKIPATLPKLTLKTADGISTPMYINHIGNGVYYFDTYVEDIDKTKEYYIEAKSTDKNNTATDVQKTQNVLLPNKELGRIGNYKLKIANNKMKFVDAVKYEGAISTQLLNISMNKNAQGAHYISGNIIIIETVDEDIKIPETLPKLTLKTADGISTPMYINHIGNGVYYFDTYVEEIDKTKEYYIEAKSTDKNNTATDVKKTQNVLLPNKELGRVGNYKLKIANNKMKFVDAVRYEGTISTQIQNIEMMQNAQGVHYISGNIKIVEIVDGVEKVPTKLPELTLKTADGISIPMYIHHTGSGVYYFDTYIEEIDKTKEYYIEAKSTDKNNIATDMQKTQIVTIQDEELGIIETWLVRIEDSKLLFI